jgi:hypothetical protein
MTIAWRPMRPSPGAPCRFVAAVGRRPARHHRHFAPLRGGAIQENWSVDIGSGRWREAGRHALVLRTDAARAWPPAMAAPRNSPVEACRAAGVAVPDRSGLPRSRGHRRAFYLMRRVAGVAAGTGS